MLSVAPPRSEAPCSPVEPRASSDSRDSGRYSSAIADWPPPVVMKRWCSSVAFTASTGLNQ